MDRVKISDLLDGVIAHAEAAKAALLDEHEGNLRTEVDRMWLAAFQIATVVDNW